MILSAQEIFKSHLHFVFNFNTGKDFEAAIIMILSDIRKILIINKILKHLSKDIKNYAKETKEF